MAAGRPYAAGLHELHGVFDARNLGTGGRRGRLPGAVVLLGNRVGAPLTPTAPTSASKTTTRAGPAPITGPLEKDWKSYGGTAYFGCPQTFSAGKSALDDIRPKIFDPKTGQYVAPAIPTIAAGENLTGAMCALTGAAADLKVVYVVTTVKPAQAPAPEISRTTAYSYDWSSGHQVATKELQPPTPA